MKNMAEAGRAVEKHADTVRRVCFIHLKNYSDVEDVFQDVFLKYILYNRPFENAAHEKAWLIRVAINRCRDVQKSHSRRKLQPLEYANEEAYIQDSNREIIEAVHNLPEKYRNVIYLFYYEGYTAVEIARILHKNENTVYTWLSRAKSMLRDALGGERFDE